MQRLHITRGVRLLVVPALLSLVAACASDSSPPDSEPGADEADLDLGDRLAGDMKADGNWGHALECKPVPNLPPLAHPKITLSIDGLTLHLVDVGGTYDKVFPVGPGKIDLDDTDPEFGESLSYRPIISAGTHDFKITPSSIQPCKTWWTDSATGEKSPVFAGLPFLSWSGAYAIHGPIDNFRAANGGNLRRGYVSHGCFRMEADGILEVYARIKGVANVPVHVQRERERRADGSIVDIESKWIGSSCSTNSECNYPNGFCATNAFSTQGFCSATCTQFCSDRPGAPSTFCVANPAAPSTGMCVPKMQNENLECRPYDHFGAAVMARFNSSVTANVCVPKSPGWIGDHCFASSDCTNGTVCRGAHDSSPGICTQDCSKICPDEPGWSETACALVPSLSTSGTCVRKCTPSSNASECPSDMTCGPASRPADSTTRNVCLPAAR